MPTLTPPRRRVRVIAGLVAVAALVGATLTPTLLVAPESASAAPISGVVNSYQDVSAVSGTTVTVTGPVTGAGTPFAVGDRVVLIQMTGTAPATGSNFGNYDRTTITAISGSTITLASIARSYSPASEAVQLVRVAYATGTTTVSGTVTAKAWDGVTGGVVAVAGDTLQLTSNIDATGTGFTNTNPPTGTVVASLTSGPGSATGRGFDGRPWAFGTAYESGEGGLGGGGVGGGGGSEAIAGGTRGGGLAGGGDNGLTPTGSRTTAAGTDGGGSVRFPSRGVDFDFGGGVGAGGGGGVVGGGGGGGGQYGSGGGGGVAGGGSGGGGGVDTSPTPQPSYSGAGGGGVGSVGNGGDGLPGGPNTSINSSSEGSAGAGGGSYGGGGGVASNYSGGDDSAGGGGGGSWFGGGLGGVGGSNSPIGGLTNPWPAGGNGNSAVGTAIPDSAHFLNETNPRLMMGGAGGRGSADSGSILGGAGGGIVIVDFETVQGPGAIRSDGANGLSPASAGGGAHSGSGAGAGGQMLIEAGSVSSPIVVSVKGGLGGAPSANAYHAGVPGGGGGAGGVWLRVEGATATCPSSGFPNVSFDLDGGSSGTPIINPKNGATIGTAGDGATGLACVSPRPVTNPTVSFLKALNGSRVGAADQFRLEVRSGSISGPVLGSSTTTGSGATVDPGTGRVTVDPATSGTTYVLTEAGASGANLADYVSTIQCVDAAGLMSAGSGGVTSGAVPFDPAVGHSVTPVDGADIQCTLTNRALVPGMTFDKRLVSSVKQPDGSYVVQYAIDVRNTGETAEPYTLTDTLRPGAGAIFQSGSWSGPTSGTFTGAGVATTMASGRMLAAGASETYAITVTYAIDPDLVTGSGASASNLCKPDGTDPTGFFGFHNTATFSWDGGTSVDDVCPPFDLVHGMDMAKSLVSSTKGVDGRYTVIYRIVVDNTGDFTELYDLTDRLLPGAGAVLQSGSWSRPGGFSGTFTGPNVATTLASGVSLAAGGQHIYTVTAVYAIDPSLVTGTGSGASNECKPDNTDYTGSFGFHNTASFTWNGGSKDDDACDPFPFGFSFRKALDGPRWQPGDQFRLEVHVGTLTGPLAGSSTTTGSGETIDPTTGAVTVTPAVAGQTYVLTEVGSSGALLSDYDATIVCVDVNGKMTAGQGGVTGTVANRTGVAFDPAVGHAITPVAGSSIDCELTNRSFESGVVYDKHLNSSTRNTDGSYTVVYDIVVTNTGERVETYSLTDTLLPGSGAVFDRGTWAGQTQGTFTGVNVATVLATDESIDPDDIHTYTVTVRYRVDAPAIRGSGIGASNQCKTDNVYYDENYGMHNTAELSWRERRIKDDACAPFTTPKLALTGATLGGALGATVLVQSAVALVLGGGALLLILAIRRRRDRTNDNR